MGGMQPLRVQSTASDDDEERRPGFAELFFVFDFVPSGHIAFPRTQ